jgi:hypothetical protein
MFSMARVHDLVSTLWPSLIKFATHCCRTASTSQATCTLAEPENNLLKNTYEHYHDLPKRCIPNLTGKSRDFGLLDGKVANFGHNIKIHLSPDHSS